MYYLFAGHDSDMQGGSDDFVGKFEFLEEARELAEKHYYFQSVYDFAQILTVKHNELYLLGRLEYLTPKGKRDGKMRTWVEHDEPLGCK